jgi:hypothetical protein
MAKGQRPKNNHNRMITGIGTPSSQSRSPRPIFASMKTLIHERNGRGRGSEYGKAFCQCPMFDIGRRSN